MNINDILNQLPVIEDSLDLKMIQSEIETLIQKGWSPNDVIAYVSCMEEVNPMLDEFVAISRMSNILSKYKI